MYMAVDQKKAKKSQKFSKKAKLQYGTLIEEHDLPSKIFAIFTTLSISWTSSGLVDPLKTPQNDYQLLTFIIWNLIG